MSVTFVITVIAVKSNSRDPSNSLKIEGIIS